MELWARSEVCRGQACIDDRFSHVIGVKEVVVLQQLVRRVGATLCTSLTPHYVYIKNFVHVGGHVKYAGQA
jgi:hypothetical protein